MHITGIANLKIPSSVKLEHQHLHHELEAAEQSGGKTAQAAKEVHQTLKPHFLAEEEFAMPQLGALGQAAAGQTVAGAQTIIALSEKLEAEMPKMLQEHKQITEALNKLRQAAIEENKPAQAEFAEKLKLHAQTEEEILYPSSILLGKYLKQQNL